LGKTFIIVAGDHLDGISSVNQTLSKMLEDYFASSNMGVIIIKNK
jgi:hypothetical protein